MQDPLFDPADFRIPDGIAHVCAAGETPFLRSHDAAMLSYAVDKSNGMAGRSAQEAVHLRARGKMAALWSVDVENVAFVANVAEGMSLLVESLDWQPGDAVCVDEIEYPSLVYPLKRLAERGVLELRIATRDRPLSLLVDERTKLIAASLVSYLNGARADLPALRALADGCGAMLVVDFSQAAGYMPVEAELCDFAFSCCYKWLLGCTGAAALFWSAHRQPDWLPRTAGWYSVRRNPARPDYSVPSALRPDALRVSRGNPAFPSLYVLDNALTYLGAHEAASVWRHVDALAARLQEGIATLGLPGITPRASSRRGASVAIETSSDALVTEKLAEKGVWIWCGARRIRFSFHGYNNAADVDRALNALEDVRPHLQP